MVADAMSPAAAGARQVVGNEGRRWAAGVVTAIGRDAKQEIRSKGGDWVHTRSQMGVKGEMHTPCI
jgi:hypothetical protein